MILIKSAYRSSPRALSTVQKNHFGSDMAPEWKRSSEYACAKRNSYTWNCCSADYVYFDIWHALTEHFLNIYFLEINK